MMRLDYSLSPSWNRTAVDSLANATDQVLRYRFFLGDLTFVIDEVDLSAPWGWVPVLDFALALEAISDALAGGVASDELFEFTESDASIRFRAIGDKVEVEASYAPGIASVDLGVLRQQARRFSDRVLADAIGRHPELGANELIARHRPRP